MKLSASVILLLLSSRLAAQQPVVQFTAEQDQRDMMDQLGIRRLRPPASPNETAPNHANFDQALANPYPELPAALRGSTARLKWSRVPHTPMDGSP